eukprot:568713_1
MGNKVGTSNSSKAKQKSYGKLNKDDHFTQLKSVSTLSQTNLSDTELDDMDAFLNEEKEALPEEHLHRLWIRDSGLWSKKFNGKRDKFLKMVKLSRAVKITS